MAESAALLVDEEFPEQPLRQWVLSVPYPLRNGHYLERQGWLTRDAQNGYLTEAAGGEGAMEALGATR